MIFSAVVIPLNQESRITIPFANQQNEERFLFITFPILWVMISFPIPENFPKTAKEQESDLTQH